MSYLVKISGIYIITSLIDDKYYIGRSYNCMERFSQHKSRLRKGTHDNKHLQYAWNKYGEENFTFEILDENEKEILPSLENWWCNMLNTHDRKYGYNVDPTSPYGKISISKETIEKIRKSNTGKIPTQETRDKLSLINIGKHLSIETIEKLKNTKMNIKVDMYDKYGKFISTYKSLREASRINNMYVSEIRKCICGKFNLSHEKIFKFHGEILTKEEIDRRNKNSISGTKVPVVGYTLDGIFVGKFDSYYKASKFTNQHPTKISLCCRANKSLKPNRKKKRVKNIIWTYLDK